MKLISKGLRVLKVFRDKGIWAGLQYVLDALSPKVVSVPAPIIARGRFTEGPIFPVDQEPEFDPEMLLRRGRTPYILSDQTPADLGLPDTIPVLTTVQLMSVEEIGRSAFYVFFTFDSTALPEIERIIKNGGWIVPPKRYSKTPWRFVNEQTFRAIERTLSKASRISHFDFSIHENLCEALHMTRKLDGDFVEIGVYLGGSSLTSLNYLDILNETRQDGPTHQRRGFLVDTYDGFTYSTAESSGDQVWSGTHTLFGVEETQQYIKETLEGVRTPFKMIASNICEDDLPPEVKKISVANIDVDLYEATRDALLKVSPRIQVGGIIICEDPSSTPWLYGAYLAMEEFLKSSEGRKFQSVHKTGSYFLIRIAS
jgi:hypothetical protein